MLIVDVFAVICHISYGSEADQISVFGTTEETRIVKISSEVNMTGRSDTAMPQNVSF